MDKSPNGFRGEDGFANHAAYSCDDVVSFLQFLHAEFLEWGNRFISSEAGVSLCFRPNPKLTARAFQIFGSTKFTWPRAETILFRIMAVFDTGQNSSVGVFKYAVGEFRLQDASRFGLLSESWITA